jgi:hypothetical protein
VTLHGAIVEVLRAHGGGWMDRDEIAAEIARRNLYRRADGAPPPSDQIRSGCAPASPSISTSLSAATRRASGSACARA